MRYLQKYKAFESLMRNGVYQIDEYQSENLQEQLHFDFYQGIPSLNIDDIRDICLDITDSGRFTTSVNKSNDTNYYILINLSNVIDYDGFSFDEVKDVVLRLKNFLGNKYGGCSALIVEEVSRTKLDLNSEESIERLSKIYDGVNSSISNLVIWIS